MNDILIGIASILIGYLLGSISFSRVVTRLVSPGTDLKRTAVPVIGSDEKMHMSGISPTSVRFSLGPKYGLLSSFLDMVKVAVPAAILHFVFPDLPADNLAAMGGIIGHNWPIYYKFLGGYGHSAIYGALLVFDWIAIGANLIATIILYYLTKNVHVALVGAVMLLIPWFYFLRHDPWATLYAGVCSVAYLIRMIPEARVYRQIQKRKSNKKEDAIEGG
jgi:glycerol-3-phosphate acyltransferase PlsY